MMFFTFDSSSVANVILGSKGEIQVGTNLDGPQCCYCGSHEHLECDTPEKVCSKPVG